MKKIINILMVFVLIVPYVILPEGVGAKTLGDMKKELAKLEAEIKKNKQEKQLTEQQINQTRSNINDISKNIDQIQVDIKTLNEEIEQLNIDIANKNEEIKKIMNFVQTSNGESAYLEYAFGAQNFTDFIYRVAVSEQLANHNSKLIKMYNEMIQQDIEKKEDLRNKAVELNKKQEELGQMLKSLGKKSQELAQEGVSIEEDIRMQREAIKLYQELGCRDSDDIKNCARNTLPLETAFFRPTTSGSISSEYGPRSYKLNGQWVSDYHRGIDVTESGTVPIYAAGRGMVVAVAYHTSCGGNMIYIHHNVNGKGYTTLYAHLRNIYVSKGDVVDRYTQIATMGGSPSKETWDKCSTGQHLHFQIANGLYYKDYSYWDDFTSRSFNPRLLLNFPNTYVRWSDRLTKY